MPPRAVSVALPVPLYGTYVYTVEERHSAKVAAGSRVVVQVRGRSVIGVVIAVDPPLQPDRKYQGVLDAPDDQPSLTPAVLATCKWISSYYAAPPGLVLRAALPALLTGPGKPAPELSIRTYPVREAGGVIHVWRDPALADPVDPAPADNAVAGAWRWTVQSRLAVAAERASALAAEGVVLFATPVETEVSEILAVAARDAEAALARLSAALGAPDAPEPPPVNAKPGWVTVQTA